MYMVFSFFSKKKYQFWRKENFQLNNNNKNLVFIVDFDVQQVTLGSARQKQSPLGLIISDQTLQTPERALFRLSISYHKTLQTPDHAMIRPYRLWMGSWSDYPDRR